jgi:hypothetical protein
MNNEKRDFQPWKRSAYFEVDGIPVIEQLKENWRELANEYERFKHIQIPYGLDIYSGNWLVGAFRTEVTELNNMDIKAKRAAIGPLLPKNGEAMSDKEIEVTYEKFWEMRLKRNRNSCPLLTSILDPMYPHACLTYLYSTLEPGVEIAPHRGRNSDCLRVHVCLKEAEETWMTVEGERRTWKNGQAWGFDDALLHSVVHRGSTDRAVVIMDFPKIYIESELRKLAETQELYVAND